MLGWALRTFRTQATEPTITIWNSLVRPHLDYCSPLRSPNPSDIKEIYLLGGSIHLEYKRNGRQWIMPNP